jgi:hypothetical protein
MKRLIFASLFSAALLVTNSFGQATDGNIVGTILDASGAAVPNANVDLQNMRTGVKSSTKADSTGLYRFNNVLVGNYSVTSSASGFTTTSLKDVDVELNKTTTANITMQVGTVTTAVEISESTVLLDTTTAQVGNNFDNRMAAELPMAANPSYGVLNLALFGAGVTSSGGVGVGIGPSVGGQRTRNNNFTVEGVDNNRKDVTGPTVFVPNDAVAEFTVLQNQFSAEFGHSAGGQFNTVIRGGTNEIHGALYEYLENRDFNGVDQNVARQGQRTNPRYDQNRLGASIGGPARKNKLFYYGLFEYNPLGQASVPSGGLTYAPTAAGYAALDAMQGLNKTNLGILEKYLPAAATQAAGKAGTTTVKGVSIPLGIFPIIAPNYTNKYNWLVSVDYNISDRDQLRSRYIDNKTSAIDTNANLPIFFFPRPTTAKLFSLSEFHSFRPNLTNELRLAYNRYNDNISIPNFQFPGTDIFPNIQIQNDLNVQIGPDTNAPQATIQNVYQFTDNVSWTRGRHDFKFGGDVRDLIAASTFIQRVRGDYDYTTMERFLVDYVPDLLAERNVGGRPYSGNQMAFYAFANDTFKANRHLTLNMGIRYEFTQVPRSFKEFSLNSLADVPGVLTFAEPQPQKKNFAPRVGFAYSPGNSATTSIRGGFGMAYDQLFDNVGTNARPPQATSTVDTPVTDTPGYLANGGIKSNAVAASLTPAQARAATSSFLPAHEQLGYSVNWNLGIQHSFHRDYSLEVRYVGTRGIHLLFQDQINRNSLVTPTQYLPTYLQAPSQATLDALPFTLAGLRALSNNPLAPYGFTSTITAYVPRGNSTYHGMAVDFNKRFSAHHLFKVGYTWSHLMDDSTSEVNSTTLSPRRPQDFNNIRADWASSALDRRQRLTLAWVYEAPWFSKSDNWMARNLIGNWQMAGGYTAEAPEFATPQSAADTNLNGDSAGDRVIINTAGTKNTSSDVTALTSVRNGVTQTVAYLAKDPSAEYIRAQLGTLTNSGRNILQMRGINNWDLNFSKNLTFKERFKLALRADMFNAFNHPQYTPGRINTVNQTSRSNVTNYLTPGTAVFDQYDQVYSSNPRVMQFSVRLTF